MFTLSLTPFTSVLYNKYSAVEANDGSNIPPSEMNALYELYNATNGAEWTWSYGAGNQWDFATDANPCTDNWQGIKCSNSTPYNVIAIVLTSESMRGTLPDSIGDFAELQTLRITSDIGLNGTIPDTVGSLSNLVALDLSVNRLSGRIPDSLSQLQSLTALALYVNRLSGSFPTALCNMPHLRTMDLSNNRMQGTLPACLGNLSSMLLLGLASSGFNGTIPDSLGRLQNMAGIDLHGNALTGPLPETMGVLGAMKTISFHKNKLSGPIPASWGGMLNLTSLFMFSNRLSQALPSSLAQLSNLKELDIGSNRFTGPFASILTNLTKIQTFNIYENHFSGSIPSTLGNLTNLLFVEMYENRITGTVPHSLHYLSNLIYFEVGNNYLTGTLPEAMGGLAESLVAYRVGNNHIQGTLPVSLGKLQYVQSLFLNDNHFSGTIPRELSRLGDLIEVLLQGNTLTGNIVGVFNHTTQPNVHTIQLSNNQLTGNIPEDLFKLRILTTFAAVSNCFETALPPTVCGSRTLNTLVLDGLQAASSCQQLILPGLSNSYIVRDPLSQQVPVCLFQMHGLETLHLSGNGLTGGLPDVNISARLIDISLSHNDLTGTIPLTFQEKQWFNLDLAYNRISGSLSDGFAKHHLFFSNFTRFTNLSLARPELSIAISLENNRLSGRIPYSLQDVRNISILGSNLFACNNAKTDIPTGDHDKIRYSCGSKAFDFPYYVWLTMLVITMCATAVVLHWKSLEVFGRSTYVAVTNAQRYLYTIDTLARKTTQELRAFMNVICITDAVCWVALRCTAYILIVLLPLHTYGSSQHGTFLHQYAWGVAAAYTHGSTPTALEMTFLIGLLCLLVFLSEVAIQRFNKNPIGLSGQRSSRNLSAALRNPGKIFSVLERFLIYSLYMSISFSVVLGVNILYVYVVLYKTSDLLLFIQLLLSSFKLFWNTFCAKYLKYWTVRVVSRSEDGGDVLHVKEFMFVQLLVALINNIVIPCLVVAVVSPNCFYNVFVPAPAVKASYSYDVCAVHNDISGQCIEYTRVNGATNYHPPFQYNYQCSSSIITYYAPAFVFLCITSTFLKPTWQLLALALSRVQRSPDSRVQAFLNRFVPKILRALDPQAKCLQPNLLNPYYDANRITVLLFTYLGTLMTFGAVFPPLAVAMLLSLLVISYNGKLRVGRFISMALEKDAPQYLQVLETECARTSTFSILPQSIWMVVTVSSLFYTLFLFDMLGDALGFDDAYWILIFMPLFPCVLYLFNYFCAAYYSVWFGAVVEEEETPAPEDDRITISPLALEEAYTPGKSSYAGIEFTEMSKK